MVVLLLLGFLRLLLTFLRSKSLAWALTLNGTSNTPFPCLKKSIFYWLEHAQDNWDMPSTWPHLTNTSISLDKKIDTTANKIFNLRKKKHIKLIKYSFTWYSKIFQDIHKHLFTLAIHLCFSEQLLSYFFLLFLSLSNSLFSCSHASSLMLVTVLLSLLCYTHFRTLFGLESNEKWCCFDWGEGKRNECKVCNEFD